MRQIFTIAIAAGTLAVAAFASTVTTTGLVFTQVGAPHAPAATGSAFQTSASPSAGAPHQG